MSEPKVIYLGPACEVGTGDGRTWAEDNPWPDYECGHRPVQYVLGETFDRVVAERDALQLSLNAADQRIDELTPPASSDPVTWGAPKTVRQLIQQLLTLDQDLRPLSMLRVPGNVFDDGKERTRAVHLSISHERVDGQWLAPFKSEGEKVLAFWCRTEKLSANEAAQPELAKHLGSVLDLFAPADQMGMRVLIDARACLDATTALNTPL